MNQIPRIYPWGRPFKWEEMPKAVSVQLVEHVMGVLRAHLARSWPAGGLPIHDDADHRLVAATCSALGSLVEAHAAPHHRHGVRELALQIQDLLHAPPKAGEIQSLRDDRDITPAVYYSLLALIAQWVMQRMERAPDTGGPDAVDHGGPEHSR
jgi:hypothetical protein